MSTLRVYTYAGCDTCRRAVKWLRAQGLEFEERPIRQTPPTRDELRAMLEAHGGDLRKLFNTAGRDYRAQGLAEKFAARDAGRGGWSDAEALSLLAANGNLVKRPFVIGPRIALVGFDEARWTAAFGSAPRT